MTSPCLRFFIYGIGHTQAHTHHRSPHTASCLLHAHVPASGARRLTSLLPPTPRDLHRMLVVRSGEELLYVGDHIFGDIVTSKR